MEGAHEYIKMIHLVAPIVPAVAGFNIIATKGFGLENIQVIQGVVSCLVWITILSGLTHYFAKKKK